MCRGGCDILRWSRCVGMREEPLRRFRYYIALLARMHNRHSLREVDVSRDTFFTLPIHYSMHISIWKKTPRRFRSIYCPPRTAPKGVSRDAFWNSRDTKGKGRSASISPLGTPLLKVRLNQRGTDDGKNFKHHAHSLRITR